MAEWKSDLDDMFKSREQKADAAAEKQKETQTAVEEYLSTEVIPAFEELKAQLEKHGRQVTVSKRSDSASIIMGFQGNEEFITSLKAVAREFTPKQSVEMKQTARNIRRKVTLVGIRLRT